MRPISKVELVLTTDAAGAGTVTSTTPWSGYVVEVRMNNAGTALSSGTADWTLTRVRDGGTILALTNQAAPFQVFPARRLTNEAGGTTAYATGVGPVVQAGVPVDDYVQLTVAQATVSASGTVYVHVDGSAKG